MPVGHGHPAPGSRESQKIVGAPPRPKWSAKAGRAGGADPQESGAPGRPRRAAGSQNDGSTSRGRRPTLGWFFGRGVSVTFNPPWRMGAVAARHSEVVKKSPKQNFITRHFNDLKLGKVEFFTASQFCGLLGQPPLAGSPTEKI
jgi:hypothetical protein